jgi:serine protease Do
MMIPRRARPHAFLIAAFAAAMVGLFPLAPAADADAARAPIPSFASVVRQVLPAVVNIAVVRSAPAPLGDSGASGQPRGETPLDELLRRFFEPFGGDAERLNAQGSGFIVDPLGFIATSAHLLDDAQTITVVLQDGSRFEATIVGRDELTDLALVKVAVPRRLPSVSWGDSDAVEVGDWILAVGNPFGLGGSVSAGILSARGRDIHEGPYDDFLQIDAPLNRGNSGGPTFNAAGEVVGVNTAIYTPSGGSVGIGFAVPSNLARPVIEQLRAHGKVVRGWLGVEIQELTPALAASFGIKDAQGVLVTAVMPGGPADKAGLRPGDIVLSFAGHAVLRLRDLALATAVAPIGVKATVTLWRDGRQIMLWPVIAEMPQAPAAPPAPHRKEQGVSSVMGLHLTALTASLREDLGLAATVKGVVVLNVADDSPFANSGLERGDVIEEINRHGVASVESAKALLQDAAANPARPVLMLINRQGSSRYLAFSMAASGAME